MIVIYPTWDMCWKDYHFHDVMLCVALAIMLMQCYIVISLIKMCGCNFVEIFILYVVPTIMLMQCYIVIYLINICGGYIYYDISHYVMTSCNFVEIFMLRCFMMMCEIMWWLQWCCILMMTCESWHVDFFFEMLILWLMHWLRVVRWWL